MPGNATSTRAPYSIGHAEINDYMTNIPAKPLSMRV